MYSNENDEISKEDRDCISRVCNIITALANLHVPIYETIIAFAYEASLEYQAKELLQSKIQKIVVDQARHQVQLVE